MPLDKGGLRTRTYRLETRSCEVGVFANGMAGYTTQVCEGRAIQKLEGLLIEEIPPERKSR